MYPSLSIHDRLLFSGNFRICLLDSYVLQPFCSLFRVIWIMTCIWMLFNPELEAFPLSVFLGISLIFLPFLLEFRLPDILLLLVAEAFPPPPVLFSSFSSNWIIENHWKMTYFEFQSLFILM